MEVGLDFGGAASLEVKRSDLKSLVVSEGVEE